MCPAGIKKFVNKGIDLNDALILNEIRENVIGFNGYTCRYVSSFNDMIKEFDKLNYEEIKRYGLPFSCMERGDFYWDYHMKAGPLFYKINKNGKVTLVELSKVGVHHLKKMPTDLLELSDLKFLWLFFESNKEDIPDTLRSNKKFEVEINPYDFNDEMVEAIKINMQIPNLHLKIDLNNFFELKIYRKELKDQIFGPFSEPQAGSSKIITICNDPKIWVMNEAFKKDI